MTLFSQKTLRFSIICSLLVLIFGCSGPVRHINSDVCLVKQGNSPKEVMDILGPPNVKRQTETGEIWTYYSAQKSPLKRTPGVNLLFGTITYDVIHVTITNNVVSNCQYRHATEEEFEHSKIASTPQEEQ